MIISISNQSLSVSEILTSSLYDTHVFFPHVREYSNTTNNTVISRNFLMWKFCRKAQFPYSFGRFARNYAKTVPFHKISHQEIRRNYGILRSVNIKISFLRVSFTAEKKRNHLLTESCVTSKRNFIIFRYVLTRTKRCYNGSLWFFR